MKELGVALIGCGGMAASYRSVYAGLPGVSYRLVVDIDGALAERVAAELGVARSSTDWRDALTDDIHLVDISTPNHRHAEQAVALLEAGKHVILQKPMAPSVAECHEIVAAEQRSGCLAGLYMSDLEDPLVWDFREILRQGLLGTVTGIRARYAHRGGLSAPARPDYWRGSAEKTGGGSFMQLSLHHLNLVSWLLDDRVQTVMASSKNLACPNIAGDDTTACIAEFERSGVIGVFESAWSAEGSQVQLYGTAGTITFFGTEGAAAEVRLAGAFTGRVLTVGSDGFGRREAVGANALRNTDGPYNQHAAFVRAVQQESAVVVPATVGLYDVATVHAVYLSAREGRRVAVATLL